MVRVETGGRLKAARRSLGLSVARASGMASVSDSTIKRWEAGQGLPGPEFLGRYLRCLGAPELVPMPDLDDETGKVSQRMLRSKRRRSGVTLEQLSLLTGMSVASLHRYETGARAPDAESLGQLARAYGCSEAEAALLTQRPSQRHKPVVEGFLTAGDHPHYWLFRKLEDMLLPSTAVTPDDALDLIQGFMIMGDHRGLLEAWELIGPKVKALHLEPGQVAGIAVSLALARFTVTGDRAQARARVACHAERQADMPIFALSHLARLATLSGETELAEPMLDHVVCTATRSGETGIVFGGEVNRALLAFARSQSPKILDALDRLSDQSEIPLHNYTANVAKLHMLSLMRERTEAARVLDSCARSEAAYGFGSPLACRIRRTLDA